MTDYNATIPGRAHRLALLGLTDAQIADAMGFSESTIKRWKNEHEKFRQALDAGKAMADGYVAQALYRRARGYSHRAVDIKVVNGRIVETEIIKRYPPDTTAAIFWLKNRQPGRWSDKKEIDHRIEGITKPLTEEELLERLKQVKEAGTGIDTRSIEGNGNGNGD